MGQGSANIEMFIKIIRYLYKIFYLESVDVVDEGRLGRDLEISDDGVSLATEIDEVGVGVVDGEHDAVAGVQLHHHDRVVQVT